MLRLFCLMTGDDYNLVKIDTPASKKKVSALATVLFIPVSTWFVIGFTMAKTILKLPVLTSILVAIGTASIIFVVERVIIMSGTNKWLVGLRVFMGLIIAILGSVFIDEVIFEKDIDQQVFMDRKELIEAARKDIATRFEPALSASKVTVADAHEQWYEALQDAKAESDGSGGSGVRGVHSIAKLKLTISDQLEASYKTAKSELAQLEAKFETDLAQSQSTMSENISGNSLLFRIKSLFKLVLSDNWVLAIYSLFTILLFILEFIVIIMKHALGETNYELRVAAMETVGKRRLVKITETDARLFDPSDTSEAVRTAERILKTASSSVFRSPQKHLASNN